MTLCAFGTGIVDFVMMILTREMMSGAIGSCYILMFDLEIYKVFFSPHLVFMT